MTKLSEIALNKCAHIILAIKEHPFNKELADGSLALAKFAYYIEQDTLYLRDFARCLAMIAAKAPLHFIKDFLSFAEGALIAEQEVVHDFYRQEYNLLITEKISPATVSYTSYLLQVCSTAPVEIAIAAVLPCFRIYQIVGQSIANSLESNSHHPYEKWIETYSSQEFSDNVARAISIFDQVAQSASDKIRISMLDAFYKSAVLEWHFWNDSYHQKVFDALHEDEN